MSSELFDKGRHEPLADLAWDEAAAREGAARIARAILQDRTAAGNWTLHPLDQDAGGMPQPHEGLYLGSVGVLMGLARLARAGVIEPLDDLPAQLEAAHARYSAAPDAGDDVPSWFVGEAGVLAARLSVERDEDLLMSLAARVDENAGGEERDLLYGSPGTVLAAALVLERAGDHDGLRRAGVKGCNTLLTDVVERRSGAHWVQRLGGDPQVNLGAAHGLAGVLCALAAGARAGLVVDEPRWHELAAAGRRTLLESAHVEATRGQPPLVNWPVHLNADARADRFLVQWCHGAPGVLLSMCSAFPQPCEETFEEMLVAAGELTWRAGPPRKGPTLCHGTAGNGWALLKMFERTSNVGWLERARLFAMHALAQADAARALHGRPRPSLFTGDVGVALFLLDCVDATADVPALDSL